MTNKTSGQSKTCWRVLEGSSTRILICSIFTASTAGVELRVGYFGDPPLHSQIVVDIESAQALAQDWLRAVRADGDLSRLGQTSPDHLTSPDVTSPDLSFPRNLISP
jgi:hypothetical protein